LARKLLGNGCSFVRDWFNDGFTGGYFGGASFTRLCFQLNGCADKNNRGTGDSEQGGDVVSTLWTRGVISPVRLSTSLDHSCYRACSAGCCQRRRDPRVPRDGVLGLCERDWILGMCIRARRQANGHREPVQLASVAPLLARTIAAVSAQPGPQMAARAWMLNINDLQNPRTV
jgi:hypothetical protein